jgi:hypothetical protein
MVANAPQPAEEAFCRSYVLTVAAGKRLIAKGVAAMPEVIDCMERGTLAVCKGTTNAYIVEELLGMPIDKTQYVTGRTVPPGSDAGKRLSAKMAELVIQRGERLEGVSAVEAAADMQPGDILLKGANALNYEQAQVGILIGHPTGGTMGAILGHAVARRIRLIHPVGLEKSVCEDLAGISNLLADVPVHGESTPTLWVSPGELFTEIEAVAVLCGAEAYCMSAGGVGGAEGAVWLLVAGTAEQLERFNEVYETLRAEPPLL